MSASRFVGPGREGVILLKPTVNSASRWMRVRPAARPLVNPSDPAFDRVRRPPLRRSRPAHEASSFRVDVIPEAGLRVITGCCLPRSAAASAKKGLRYVCLRAALLLGSKAVPGPTADRSAPVLQTKLRGITQNHLGFDSHP